METYFSKFPNTTYSDLLCKNISRRAGLSNEIRNLPTLFYPYEIKAGQRADLVAYAYYQDSYYDWLIYLTNGIIDPYYDWYLDENDFDNFIIKKYGSIEESQRRIRHYAVSWADDDIPLSVSFYDDTLPESLKKYYTPIFGQRAQVISYTRRREDWTVNTNKILNFTVNVHSSEAFSNGELVDVRLLGEDVGRAEIVICNSTVVTVQHISGNTSANNLLTGLTSSANATILDTDTVEEVLTDEEFVYWEAVTFYEWERQKNENNKQVYLLDANWSLEAAEQLRKRMQE